MLLCHCTIHQLLLFTGAEGQIALRIVRELANAGEKVVAGAAVLLVLLLFRAAGRMVLMLWLDE
jgi:NAD(P)-dependent dehydrogenase (short-subunit alcohol dehydrogenase family)